MDMDTLKAECLACTRCELCATRTNVVFGQGVPDAEVLFVGEGPGQSEDEQGLPFVGRSGQLLDKYLFAIDLDREKNCYIANIVKCRPPQNRDPLPAESDRGKKYNPVLEQLEALTNKMKKIGEKYNASCSQVGIAWALTKGTKPIIGATKERHVIEAAEAAKITLTQKEVARLEQLADATGVDTRGGWEHSME